MAYLDPPHVSFAAVQQRCEAYGLQPRPSARGFSCRCPAHDDGHASLSVAEGDHGATLFHCFTGCGFPAIAAALGFEVRQLCGEEAISHQPSAVSEVKDKPVFAVLTADSRQPTAYTLYDYRDETGCLLFQTVRGPFKDGSKAKQRRPGALPDEWVWNLQGVPRVLYRLPELLAADPGAAVCLTEGEKDVETLRALGFVATTNPGGAKGWKREFAGSLTGRRVAILPDYDRPGMERARQIQADLSAVGIACALVDLPGLEVRESHGEDVTDWLQRRGGTKEQLQALVEAAFVAGFAPEKASLREESPAVDLSSLNDAVSGARQRPPALDAWAFHGVTGDVIRLLEPHSEADPAALLLNFLVGIGNLIGRGPHARADAARHGLNLFVVLVGDTAKGRKGSSWSQVRALLERVDAEWAANNISYGLSSVEGAIWSVRDPILKQVQRKERQTGRPLPEFDTVTEDAGIADKRRLVIEGEFASVLKRMEREGNTLSQVIRQAWDGGKLEVMTRNAPYTATESHVSFVGHITQTELRRDLTQTEAGNGFGNRIGWAFTQRSKLLPEGGGEIDYEPLARQLRECVESARSLDLIVRNAVAKAVWQAIYPRLSGGGPGLLGAVTGRAAAQVLRFSALYAALDGSATIALPHLYAALAVWDYLEASARYIFGAGTGDRLADQILALLAGEPDGLSVQEITMRLGHHHPAARLQQAMAVLEGRVIHERQATAGRPGRVWRRVESETGALPDESLVEQAWRAAEGDEEPAAAPEKASLREERSTAGLSSLNDAVSGAKPAATALETARPSPADDAEIDLPRFDGEEEVTL